MFMFNVVYEDKILELQSESNKNIMELKMNLMEILDLDYDQFNFFLENFGQVDETKEEMTEYTLEKLKLGIFIK